jgi:hypothetical protein
MVITYHQTLSNIIKASLMINQSNQSNQSIKHSQSIINQALYTIKHHQAQKHQQ